LKTSAKQSAPLEISPTVVSHLPRFGSAAFLSLWLALCTVLGLWTVRQNEFVNYDDPDYVTSNSQVQGGVTWDNLRWAFTTGHASNWHPLTWVSHMLDCQWFGQQASAHHTVNLLLHSLNTVLLFLVLRRMTRGHWQSAFVAALFALHPLHVESVAWISERKDVLSTLFLLLTLGFYGVYVEGVRVGGGKTSQVSSLRYGRLQVCATYGGALVCFALGLMSKPMLVTTPFLLLLIDYWPLRRLQSNEAAFDPGRALRLVIEKLPFLALSLASSVVTFLVQQSGGAVSTSLTMGQRLGNALVSYVRYIAKMIWPSDLSVLYPHPGAWPIWAVLGAGALLAGISVVAILWARRRPYFIVGWLWFLGTLVPVIGLVQVGIQSMADRYSYVPLIGLFIIVAWGVPEGLPQASWRSRALAFATGVLLLACWVVTVRQISYWQTSETLFRRAVSVTAKNFLAYNNLGFYLAGRGQVQEAMVNYQKALEINPAYEDALNNFGYSLAGLKRFAEAIPLYEAALRIRPKHVEVHNNLGNALSEVGRLPEAIDHYRFVLQQQPGHADAHNNLGIALAMQGKLDEALPHFQAAIRFKPNYASAHSNLGNGLAAQRRFEEAIAEYRECLRLNPQDAQAHNNMANVFAEQSLWPEAVEHYTEALRLNPANPEAHYNLGLVLAREGKVAEAVLHCQEALRLKPNYPEARNQLASLLSKPSLPSSATNSILSR
jgi:protein O-mannosyl-transferase